MNNRETTFFNSSIPNNETVSGIRPVSIGSIALLQMLNNQFAGVMLNGDELPINNILAMLEFVYIHTNDQSEVAREIMKSRPNPESFTEKIINYGLNIDLDELVIFIRDIMRDKDNINNAKTKSIKQNNNSASKNELSQV